MRSTSRKYLFPIFALLLVGGCAGGMAAGGMHSWPSGTSTTYTVSQVQVQSLDVSAMGQGVMTTTSSVSMEVTITATGPRQFTFTVNDATSSIDDPTGQAPPENVKGLIGLTSNVTLDERGQVTEATGLSENSTVMDLGGVDEFREQIQSFFLYLPEGGLKAGVDWSRSEAHGADQGGLALQFSNNTDYHADEQTDYEGSQAWKITGTDQGTLVGGGDQMGTAIDLSATGTGDNTLYVEAGTGRLLHAEGKATFNGSLSAQGMDIPISMNIMSDIRIKK